MATITSWLTNILLGSNIRTLEREVARPSPVGLLAGWQLVGRAPVQRSSPGVAMLADWPTVCSLNGRSRHDWPLPSVVGGVKSV